MSQTAGADANAGSSWSDALSSLSAALAVATACSEVWIAEGTYLPTGRARESSFVVPDRVTLRGGFAGVEAVPDQRDIAAHITTLSGNIGNRGLATDNAFHIVRAQGIAELDGLTLSGAYSSLTDPGAEPGGAVLADGHLTVRDCTFTENQSWTGGAAIQALQGVYLVNSALSRNRVAVGSTGYIVAGDSLTVEGTAFTENTASQVGGVIVGHRISMRDSQFTANAPANGFLIEGSEVTVDGTTFESNEGGVIFNEFAGTLTMTASTVARNGSGVHVRNANIIDSTFVENRSLALRVWDDADIRGSLFERNVTAFQSNGAAVISDSQFISNGTDSGEGAVLHVGGGDLVIQRSLFESNVAGGDIFSGGGAVHVRRGSAHIVESMFIGNSSTVGGALGGSSLTSVSVSRSRFYRNTASDRGGVVSSQGSVSFEACEMVGNSAPMGSVAFRMFEGDGITLESCTVAFNLGSTGPAIAYRGTVTIRNSLLWGNTPTELGFPPDMFPQPPPNARLTIESSHVQGYASASDPLFVDGPGGDLRLSAGSPCIDRADDTSAPVTDIEGHPRLDQPGVPSCAPDAGACGSIADIGAHEFGH